MEEDTVGIEGAKMRRTHHALRTRWAAAIVAAVLTAGIPMGVSNAADRPAAAAAAVKPHVLFGTHVSPRWGLGQVDALRRYEGRVGRKFALANRFQNLSEIGFLFATIMTNQGRIPMVSWRATNQRVRPDRQRAVKIARGDFDAQIIRAADGAKQVTGTVFIRFAWEMTQAPGLPQYIGAPAAFIAAWRHVVSIFNARGASNVRFIWSPQSRSFCHGEGQSYYPGDAWVDWIGGSAVPANTWTSFQELFHCFYPWASAQGKPLITWFGIRERPGDGAWKTSFLRGARRTISTSMPRIRAIVYFNSINGPNNFWADTTSGAFNAYRAMGCARHFEARAGCG